MSSLRLPTLRAVLGPSVILLAARAGGTLLGFLLQAYLARALGADGLGAYYMMVSLTGVCAVVGAVGYPVIASRFVARYRARPTPGMLRLFLRIGLIDTAIVAVVLGAAISLGAVMLAEDPHLRWALLIAALSIPPLAVARFASAVANATRRFYIAFLPELVVRPAVLFLLVGGTVLLGGSIGVVEVLAYYALVSWGLMLLQIACLDRPQPGGAAPQRKLPRLAPIWRRLAAVLMVTPLITAMLGDVDLLLLSPLLDRDQIGVFGAALKMAMLFGFFVQIIHQTMLPDLAEAVHRKRLAPALASAVLANRVAFVFVLLSAVFAAAFGDRLLGVFGEEFMVARWPLVLLVLGLAPRAAAGPTSQLLVVLGRENLTVASGLLSVACLAAANAALVPVLGLLGAALSFTGMMALSTCSLSWLLWRHEGIRADIFVRTASAPRLGRA